MTNNSTLEDEKYMRRALQLARCGREYAAPNPMVGAVLVADGRIIGEGYHRRCGGPHAEVNAITPSLTLPPSGRGERLVSLAANSSNEKIPSPALRGRAREGVTLYVTLEPCAHYGKTPPCAKLIIDTGIPRVVVGCRDPFAKVDGLGIKMLRDAGIDVTVGVLEEECRELNRRFMTYHSQHRPFVTLKWAQSEDGFIDRKRDIADYMNVALGDEASSLRQSSKGAVKLSNCHTQQICHRRRAEHDAILVGWRTNVLDRPSLTTRLWPGSNPLRVVMERQTPQQVLAELYERGVQSVLVEGGSATLQAFIDAGLWDEAYVETAPVRLGDGVPAPQMPQFAAI